MPFIIPANSAVSGGFNVANSVNCGDTSTRWTGSNKVTSTNQKKGSWNIWLKRTVLGAQGLFKVYDSGNTGTEFGFDSSDQFFMKEFESGSDVFNLKTNAKYRDPSAWMHILLAIDTTQGTEANRIRLYINGVEPSLATSTRPSVNTNLVRFFANGADNSNQQHEMGNNYDGATGHYLLTQILYVDGTQLANTDVGEFDEDSNIWKPINISGTTLGNNGYYLSMEDSSNFGVATGKSFTAHGFAATDSRTDTCTNNFATINPLIVMNTDTVYSEGNLVMTPGGNTGNWQIGFSSIAVSAGKWYVETKMIGGNYVNGISETTSNQLSASGPEHFIGGFTKEIGYYSQSGNKFVENSQSSYGASYTNGDIMGMALDLDSGTRTITFFKNGASQGAITLPSSMETMTFGMSVNQGSSSAQFNFGSPPYAISSGNADGNGYGNFEYAVPSGYFSLNTKNLAEYG